MLKIAFIVAFGGLIAHMAQTHPSNQYDMEICPEIFNTYIGKQCPRDLIMPLPEEISITRSRGLLSGSVEYTVNNLLQIGLVHVTVSLMTVSGKKLLVDVDARVRVGGIFCNSRDMDSQTKVEMLVHVHFSFLTELHLQSMGKLHCGKLPNKSAFIVNGGVQFLDGDVLGDPELQPVLRKLCAEFESYIKANSATLVEQLQKATIKGLEELLAGMTTPELTEDSPKQEGCTQKIKDVNTDGPNIKLIVETTHVIPAGNQVSASEIPKPIPLPVAGTDTGSQWVLTDAQINSMLKTLATKKLTLTNNLEAFSVALKQAGVNVPPVTKVVLTPTQPPQVAIAGNRITGQLGGTLVLYAGDQKIVTANGTLTIDGRLEYNAPCVNILTNFVGMGDVHVVESAPGYNCEGINGMDKQFTAIITGKAFIEACVACSPAASLPPPCSTEIRPMEGYAIIDHKRSI